MEEDSGAQLSVGTVGIDLTSTGYLVDFSRRAGPKLLTANTHFPVVAVIVRDARRQAGRVLGTGAAAHHGAVLQLSRAITVG
jgi:hypothetical protein